MSQINHQNIEKMSQMRSDTISEQIPAINQSENSAGTSTLYRFLRDSLRIYHHIKEPQSTELHEQYEECLHYFVQQASKEALEESSVINSLSNGSILPNESISQLISQQNQQVLQPTHEQNSPELQLTNGQNPLVPQPTNGQNSPEPQPTNEQNPLVLQPKNGQNPPQPQSANQPNSSLLHPIPNDSNKFSYINPDHKKNFDWLDSEMQSYAKRFEEIADTKKKMILMKIKNIMNRIHPDTVKILSTELREFINGRSSGSDHYKVEITNETETNVCLKYLAMSISDQLLGTDLTETKGKYIFPLISEINTWPQKQIFRNMFLFNLYQQCIYLIPAYPAVAGCSEEEKLKRLGYRQIQEDHTLVWETKEKFLKRMEGLIRLFLKLITTPDSLLGETPSLPWGWFAALLNSQPIEDVTALLIRVFLQVAGKYMLQIYKLQFRKFLILIKEEFITKLQSVTDDGEMIVLQNELTNILK